MLKKVCLLVNYNLYQSKRYFSKKLAEAMSRAGIEVKFIDVREQKIDEEISAEIQLFNPDITCSFHNFIQDKKQKFLWDYLKIPHVSFLVDPAPYSLHLTKSPYSILSCVDRFECASLKDIPFDKVFFWPHAVEEDLETGKGDRPYDVVFFGSCYDYESLYQYWHEELPISLCEILDHAIEIILSDKFISLFAALASAWENSHLPYQGIDFHKLFYYLDQYTRGKDRVELLSSIDNDTTVHVFGELMVDNSIVKHGWGHYLEDKPNIVIHPSVPFEQSLDILKQSKICLNSMPFFKNGSHERVFTGLACGCLPLTTDSLFWQECFSHQELLTYRPSQWSEVNEIIKTTLQNENKRKEMAQLGRQNVMKNHTWDKRVEQLTSAMTTFL